MRAAHVVVLVFGCGSLAGAGGLGCRVHASISPQVQDVGHVCMFMSARASGVGWVGGGLVGSCCEMAG